MYSQNPAWGYSTQDYYARQFPKLKPGMVFNTEQQRYTTGWLDYPAHSYITNGIGLILTGKVGDAFKVQVPSAANQSSQFFGLLAYDATLAREIRIQTPNTALSQSLVPIMQEGTMVVWTDSPVAVTDPVYLIFSAIAASTGVLQETPGHFKNVAGSGNNGFLIKGAKWLDTLTTPGYCPLQLFNVSQS